MRIKFVRSIGIVLGITALLLIAPAVCAASMGNPMEASSSSPCQQADMSQPCFTTSSDSMSHCVLIRAMGEQVKPARLIAYDNICVSDCLITAETGEPSQEQAGPYQQDILKIPPSSPSEHRCRNLLTSEEPPLY